MFLRMLGWRELHAKHWAPRLALLIISGTALVSLSIAEVRWLYSVAVFTTHSVPLPATYKPPAPIVVEVPKLIPTPTPRALDVLTNEEIVSAARQLARRIEEWAKGYYSELKEADAVIAKEFRAKAPSVDDKSPEAEQAREDLNQALWPKHIGLKDMVMAKYLDGFDSMFRKDARLLRIELLRRLPKGESLSDETFAAEGSFTERTPAIAGWMIEGTAKEVRRLSDKVATISQRH